MDKKIYIGAAYYPEHWPPERWPEDIRLMKEGGVNCLRLAELAWAKLEPFDGEYDFAWLDTFIEMVSQIGVRIILGTPSEASPTWLRRKHPEIVATDRSGNITGGRGSHCHTNSAFRYYVSRFVDKMAQHYAANPHVIGWQIDNELRGIPCYCEECKVGFREWLKERYGTLENLNEQWGTVFWSQVYNTWEEILPPVSSELNTHVSQILDFKRFTSDAAIHHLNNQVTIIKKYAPHQFVTHNAFEITPNLNFYKLAEKLDFMGWDLYPAVDSNNWEFVLGHDFHRSTKRQNFWVPRAKEGIFQL